jgi:hypothetical protein
VAVDIDVCLRDRCIKLQCIHIYVIHFCVLKVNSFAVAQRKATSSACF